MACVLVESQCTPTPSGMCSLFCILGTFPLPRVLVPFRNNVGARIPSTLCWFWAVFQLSAAELQFSVWSRVRNTILATVVHERVNVAPRPHRDQKGTKFTCTFRHMSRTFFANSDYMPCCHTRIDFATFDFDFDNVRSLRFPPLASLLHLEETSLFDSTNIDRLNNTATTTLSLLGADLLPWWRP